MPNYLETTGKIKYFYLIFLFILSSSTHFGTSLNFHLTKSKICYNKLH